MEVPPRRRPAHPRPLAAVVLCTALSVITAPGVARISLTGSLFDAVTLPELPDGNWQAITFAVISMALIASIESLLSAVAVDKMQNGPRTNLNKELVARGRQHRLGVAGRAARHGRHCPQCRQRGGRRQDARIHYPPRLDSRLLGTVRWPSSPGC